MSNLKTITTKNGRQMHYLDGKLISQAQAKELAETVDPTSTSSITKVCLFCGAAATHTKFVHLKIVDLCTDDYFTKTTGEIGEQLNGTG